MGVSFSIPCDPCINKVSQWLDKKVACTHNLKKNLVALEIGMENLDAKRDDLFRKVKREEDRGLQRLAEIQVWLNRVEIVQTNVNDLFSARNVQLQRLYLCGFCSRNLISSYRYGKSVLLMLREVEELNTRVFDVIAEQAITPEVQERPLQPTIVGQDTMLDKAWKHLMEDRVSIMGMYGMGGVGKTTLLTQINNKFSNERCGFDYVIWVVVSKELHVEKIQDEIAQKVGLGGGEWNQKDESQKSLHLYNFLMKKRFVLFLDDIWEKVDLDKIGIPDPTLQNQCKLAFTTRSLNVCTSMGVEEPMEVQCLRENDAFDLFQKKVGQITLGSDPMIPILANIVAKKCCGLPLALNVVGETMSCKRTVQQWRHAINVLTSYASEFSGMEDKILPLLKYSYDSLKGDQVKSCFLYCALFPEDGQISKEKIIDYWICEGIIDGSDGIEKAEDKGYDIIGSLVDASLLMENIDWHKKAFVCMHDVVREMALWIASDLGIQKETFIVRAGVGLYEIPKVKNWNIGKRMALMNNKFIHLAGNPKCLVLTTLLLQRGNLSNISSDFFKSMPKLAVLDLSGNRSLSELPEELFKLVSLKYLNLSYTDIRCLPKRLQKFKKLIHFDLEHTRKLESIDGISSLHNLKVLKLQGSGFRWHLDTEEELEALEHLEILTAGIYGPYYAGQFVNSHRLMSCIQSLSISFTISLESSGISLPATMDKLRDFSIWHCRISEIKMGRICSFLSLVEVRIDGCKCLRELTFLMFAPNLKSLLVRFADQLEDIINKEKACEVENSGIVPFPNLNRLLLECLPKLKNIYWSILPFPYLKEIEVVQCPNLRKLPLDSQSGMQGYNGLFIRCPTDDWIRNVEWEDEATKTRFLPSRRQSDDLDVPEEYDL